MAHAEELETRIQEMQSMRKELLALARSADPKDLLFDKYVVMHTSGTSGEVGYFIFGKADQRRSFRGMWRNRKAMRPRSRPRIFKGLRRIRVAFYGATGEHYAGVTGVARLQSGLARLVIYAQSFDVNSPLPTIVDQLNGFKPDFLFGYTTALKILGDQQRAGNLNIDPASIAATGEMVTRADIEFLSESFGAVPVSSIYARTEHMLMGYSNPDHETMTLVDSNLIFELYDDHSLVSNLFNYSLPLIRYQMSDILMPVSDEDSVQEVRDQSYIDEECDGLGLFLAEDTFDWYAQDVNGNVWYFGEYTVSYDWEECENPDGFGGCLDGGWEAGKDVVNTGKLAIEGIIMLDDPRKGDFYFQEYYEDVATDMGKVLNFKDVDTLLYGKQKDCLRIKEWLPLDPGSIEHKYYCYGIGLVLVAELTGGKTLWVELISETP